LPVNQGFLLKVLEAREFPFLTPDESKKVARKINSSNLAQKSHVKSQSHLNHSPATTSTWRMSYPQFAILNIEIENEAAPTNIRS
jgi:hypothetical protein